MVFPSQSRWEMAALRGLCSGGLFVCLCPHCRSSVSISAATCCRVLCTFWEPLRMRNVIFQLFDTWLQGFEFFLVWNPAGKLHCMRPSCSGKSECKAPKSASSWPWSGNTVGPWPLHIMWQPKRGSNKLLRSFLCFALPLLISSQINYLPLPSSPAEPLPCPALLSCNTEPSSVLAAAKLTEFQEY